MSIMEFLLAPGMALFTGAFALVAGLVVIELLMMLFGASLMGDADASLDADTGLDADAGLDIDAGFDAPDGDLSIDGGEADFDLDGADGDVDAPATPSAVAGWLGFGEVPFIIWVAGTLTAFGLAGYVIQSLSSMTFGALMPWWGAAAIALLPGLRIGGLFARALGRAVPKTETSAISRRSLGNRRGVIAQGTARRGQPAQARVRDGYGNLHYVRVEPVDDGVEIPTGTEVLIRGGRGPVLGAIPIDD